MYYINRMNKQQRNQRSRRRNNQQFKSHEYEIPASNRDINTQTKPDIAQTPSPDDGIRVEIYYHVEVYKKSSSQERRDAEEARIEMNRRAEEAIRANCPNMWEVCTG